jgi:hypothetical protein
MVSQKGNKIDPNYLYTMNQKDNSNESGPELGQTKEHNKVDLLPIDAADCIKTIGKTMISKDGFDMGKIIKDKMLY